LIKFFFRIFLCALLVSRVPGLLVAEATLTANRNEPIVIFIMIDGFPARALEDPRLPMPALRSLAAAGAVATGMVPINPTVI
jgi:predicted AlkP superfamily pyrophosphatase or phosphodiesterase